MLVNWRIQWPFRERGHRHYFLLSPQCVKGDLDLTQTWNDALWIFCDVVPSFGIFLHPKHFAICKYFSNPFSSLITEIAIQGGMAEFRLHLEVVFPCFLEGVYIPDTEGDTGCFSPGGRRLVSEVCLREKDSHNYFLGQKISNSKESKTVTFINC